MGFFKKIGTAVKKGMKQVSFKNIVKVGTPLLGTIPIVGGGIQQVVGNASEAHEMKKQAKKLAEEGKALEAQAAFEQANYLANQSGALVGQQVGSQLNAFTKGTLNELKSQVSQGSKEAVGQAGATVVDLTINEWFKKHWLKLVIGLGALGGVFWYFKNRGSKPVRKSYR